MKNKATLLFSCLLLSACDGRVGHRLGIESDYRIQVLGPDTIIRFESSRMPIRNELTRSYSFSDSSGRYVEVSGTVIITEK
jgi:hypothetical protein